MSLAEYKPSRAQESRAAIQRLYISMRHLFIRGSYKPLSLGRSHDPGHAHPQAGNLWFYCRPRKSRTQWSALHLRERLPRALKPADTFLISREGFEDSKFDAIVPPKRRRKTATASTDEQMYIEMTRGISESIYILTHHLPLHEAEKIRRNSLDTRKP